MVKEKCVWRVISRTRDLPRDKLLYNLGVGEDSEWPFNDSSCVVYEYNAHNFLVVGPKELKKLKALKK